MQWVNDDAARRLCTAFELFDLAEAILRQNVVRENPQASEAEIAGRIGAWRRQRPELDGDPRLRVRP